MPSSLVNGITTPLFVTQNISLVLTTWYLATLYNFIVKRSHEKPWIWALLIAMTCCIVFNTVAICYSNGILFVEYYGKTTKLWAISFFLKTCVIVNCITSISFQSAYTVFIIRLWPQIGPRWLKLVVVPAIIAAIIAAGGIYIRLHIIIASADSYLDKEILNNFGEILDLSTASAVCNLVVDLTITVAMARLLIRSRHGAGKAFRFLKTMSLFVGTCGALNTCISVILILISHVVSPYTFWRLVLLPVPGLVGAISFLSLLNNRTSWDTQSTVAGKTQGSTLATIVNTDKSGKTQNASKIDEKFDQP